MGMHSKRAKAAAESMRKSTEALDRVLFEVRMEYPRSLKLVPLTDEWSETVPGIHGKVIDNLESEPWWLAVFKLEQGATIHAHRHSEHHMDALLKRGHVRMGVGEAEVDLHDMEYLFVPAGVEHSLHACDDSVMLLRWFVPGAGPPPPIRDRTPREIRELMERVEREGRSVRLDA